MLRIGAQPPNAALLAGTLTDDSEGWSGQERTVEDLTFLRTKLTEAVEEIGGKVSPVMNIRFVLITDPHQVSVLVDGKMGHPRSTVLLRLPPPNVSLTPEVRCAVVGNVDSGKSTTLGVLTRGTFYISSHVPMIHTWPGALDDGRGRARVALFRHKHEIESGRTSSVGMEVVVNRHLLELNSNFTDPWLRAIRGAHSTTCNSFRRPGDCAEREVRVGGYLGASGEDRLLHRYVDTSYDFSHIIGSRLGWA